MAQTEILESLLLDSGKAKLAAALASGRPIRITSFKVGSTPQVPLTPDLNDVSAQVYTGSASAISYSTPNENEVRFFITLEEAAGPFDVGNILLLTDDGTPFIMGTTLAKLGKVPNAPPMSIGNRMVFSLTLAFFNVVDAIDVSVLVPAYASIPSVTDQAALPPPSATPYDAFLIQNHQRTGTPAIAIRRAIDNAWFAIPAFSFVNDMGFGEIDGGVVGDNYQPFNTIGGGTLSDTVFTRTLDGGAFGSAKLTTYDFGSLR